MKETAMFSYTVISYGAEIGFGEGETFEEAEREAKDQAAEAGPMYPRESWGYSTRSPSGITVTYDPMANADDVPLQDFVLPDLDDNPNERM
jgi:hypothetical protein